MTTTWQPKEIVYSGKKPHRICTDCHKPIRFDRGKWFCECSEYRFTVMKHPDGKKYRSSERRRVER